MEQKFQIVQLKNPTLLIREKILEFYNAGFPKSKWSREGMDIFFAEKNKGVCLVVKIDNAIVGLVIGRVKKNMPTHMTLSALLVGDKLRGNGFAKELVKRFIEKTFENKTIDKIELHFRENNDLQSFYDKLGFGGHAIVGAYQNRELKHYMEILRGDIMKIQM